MASDTIYYFSKELTSRGYLRGTLGEVQQSFNMSLTLDGTKDSVHFQVVSYSQKELTPYTILYHGNTQTWWVVSSDKVMRYANEIGYMYIHEIDCLGAIELLNARDLTDCGFRSNRYTIDSFIKRLIKLSNFELTITAYNYYGVDSSQVVGYIKTYENYTLLSALRDFTNAYNCVPKLQFNTLNYNRFVYLHSAQLDFVSKTGDNSLDVIDIDEFYDIRETRNIDKNSYGTSVITNAQNVVASNSIIFPSVGTTKLSSTNRIVVLTNGDIDDSACIRLPSPAYKVNKLTLCAKEFYVYIQKGTQTSDNVSALQSTTAYDTYAMTTNLSAAFTIAGNTFEDSDLTTALNENIDDIIKSIQSVTSFDFYDGFLYDAINDTSSETGGYSYNPFKLPLNAPSNMKAIKCFNPAIVGGDAYRYIVLTDKATRDSFALPRMGIYWERGSNLIKGFEYFGADGFDDSSYKRIAYTYSRNGSALAYTLSVNGTTYNIYIVDYPDISDDSKMYAKFIPYNLSFIVDYIPMTDLKIKVDNTNETKDIQLYNQNGKLSDGVALSKMINSYANEITQENVVRYCDYYDFDSIPSVGQVVNDNGTYYVINNISLDFYQNEQNNGIEYKIECEISMSKQIAVKSLMVNANSNIRDYGIPQTNNVARKQIYRDMFCLSHKFSSNATSGYWTIDNFLYLSWGADTRNKDLLAFINCQDTFPVYSTNSDTNTSTISDTYYQLPTTRFLLKKQIIYKLDFQDNNIIGYDSQNIASGWTTSNVLLQKTQNINTPISYVNEVGEVEGISFLLLTTEHADYVYEQYAIDNSLSGTLYISQRVFLDENGDMFQAANSVADISIEEDDYEKDALEVPVFELCFEMVDSDDVTICDNIFETFEKHGAYRMLYGFVYVDSGYATENNAISYIQNEMETYDNGILDNGVRLANGCTFEVSSVNILISFWEYSKLYLGLSPLTSDQLTPTQGKDIIIYRHVLDSQKYLNGDSLSECIVKVEPLMIIRNTTQMTINNDNKILLYVNRKEE